MITENASIKEEWQTLRRLAARVAVIESPVNKENGPSWRRRLEFQSPGFPGVFDLRLRYFFRTRPAYHPFASARRLVPFCCVFFFSLSRLVAIFLPLRNDEKPSHQFSLETYVYFELVSSGSVRMDGRPSFFFSCLFSTDSARLCGSFSARSRYLRNSDSDLTYCFTRCAAFSDYRESVKMYYSSHSSEMFPFSQSFDLICPRT